MKCSCLNGEKRRRTVLSSRNRIEQRTRHNENKEFSKSRNVPPDSVQLIYNWSMVIVWPRVRKVVVLMRTSEWKSEETNPQSHPHSHSDQIAFDISNLTESTAIEDQCAFGIIIGRIGNDVRQCHCSKLKSFLFQRLKKNVEIHRHISENRLINLLNNGNTFHRQETIEEVKNILNQL